ncbi:hypothetical protein MPER_04612, partial [Moniliophthora perniciosa FA553]
MVNGTILEHLGENGAQDVDLRLFEIAQGLAYLHSQHIVHGDLRSVRWMAPELLWPGNSGLERSQRTFMSDAYSFACVCVELYTGKPPFEEVLQGA